MSGEQQQGLLCGIGQPIMDITAVVDDIYLNKYNLKPNNMILATEWHYKLYSEVVNEFEVQYTAGGAGQNSIRVAQYYLKKPNSTSFLGAIGNDEMGASLTEMMRDEGVNTAYMVSEKGPTACCAVLLTGKNRSLVTRLGAGQYYTQEHLESPDIWKLVEKATCFYCVGFLLANPQNIMLNVAKYATRSNKIFVANLSAPFLCNVFKQKMLAVLKYTDILFGNKEEALVFSDEMNYGTSDLDEIVERMAELPKEKPSRKRIVIVTCSSEPTVVCKDGQISHYPVSPIDNEDIVDTNGAGDAFVGGFLAKFVLGCSFDECMKNANVAANMIIKQIGCSLPNMTL